MDSTQRAAQPQGFTVHTDRAAITRRYRLVFVLQGIAFVAVTTAALLNAGLGGGLVTAEATGSGTHLGHLFAPLLFMASLLGLACITFALACYAYLYGSRIAIGEPLRLDRAGFTMTTAGGRIQVPWEAVNGVRTRNRPGGQMLVIQLHPKAGPGSPGVHTELARRSWARMMRAGGPVLGSVGIHESFDQIKQAIAHFSQGRVAIG